MILFINNRDENVRNTVRVGKKAIEEERERNMIRSKRGKERNRLLKDYVKKYQSNIL